jgi:photosystem II stability/assembly factor-like uncharacterized protein
MLKSLSSSLLVPAFACVLLTVASPSYAIFGEAGVGPIDVPKSEEVAMQSKLADKFLLLGVARAGQRLVSVGEFGHILISDDEGKNWRQAKSVPTKSTLTAVVFADDKLGWTVGHDTLVLHTSDSGETWVKQYGGTETDNALLTVAFLDAKNGIAMGAFNFTIETADGGKTWKERKLAITATAVAPPKSASPEAAPAPGATAPGEASDALQAEADKRAEERATQSGVGSAYTVAEGDDAHLNAVFSGPNNAVYVAAEAGAIYRSTDGAKIFEKISTGYAGSFWGGVALADGSILAVGMRGNIWRSEDQGKTWVKSETPGADQSLASAIQTPDGSVIAVGLGGEMAVSKDGGKNFAIAYRDDRKGMNALISTADGRVLVFGETGVQDVTSEIAKLGAAPKP